MYSVVFHVEGSRSRDTVYDKKYIRCIKMRKIKKWRREIHEENTSGNPWGEHVGLTANADNDDDKLFTYYHDTADIQK